MNEDDIGPIAIISKSKGGSDHPDNLQLLCNACNSTKGSRTQAELIAALRQDGIIEVPPHTRG